MKTGTVMDEAAEANTGYLDSPVKGRRYNMINTTFQQASQN
jgi:hypothetical protein